MGGVLPGWPGRGRIPAPSCFGEAVDCLRRQKAREDHMLRRTHAPYPRRTPWHPPKPRRSRFELHSLPAQSYVCSLIRPHHPSTAATNLRTPRGDPFIVPNPHPDPQAALDRPKRSPCRRPAASTPTPSHFHFRAHAQHGAREQIFNPCRPLPTHFPAQNRLRHAPICTVAVFGRLKVRCP